MTDNKHETGDGWAPGDPTQRYDEVVVGRKSIRGYLKKPVPRELMAEIIGLAMRSPSSMNTQPWHFHVITGEPLERIRKGNTERILAGEPDSREFRKGRPFVGEHRERQIEVAKQLFAEMQVRSPKLTVAFSHSSCILMTYRVVGSRSRATTRKRGRTGCCAASGSSTRPSA